MDYVDITDYDEPCLYCGRFDCICDMYDDDCDDAIYDREIQQHMGECKYLGNDAWDCGHVDSSDDCDCHICYLL